ncbi:MAG: GAF domain-containing protein, partial [Patescibacteria group bacterium]
MLVGGILNAFLGFIVLLRDRRKASNRWFFLVAMLSSLIGILNFLLRIVGNPNILPPIWGIGVLMTYVGIIWLKVFLKGKSVKNSQIILLLLLGSLGVVITQFKGFLDNIHRVSEIVFKGNSGPLFILMLSLQLFGFLYIIIYGFKQKNHSQGLLQEQLQYVLIGMIGYGVVAITAGVIFTSIGIPQYAFLDSPASLIWVGFTTYAIVKHRLMDIRLVILRTITYSILVLVVSVSVVLSTVYVAQIKGVSNVSRYFITILLAIFIVIILDPLKKRIAKYTDKLFFKAQVNYPELLTDLSEIINREIDLDVLLFSLAHKLEKNLKVKNSSIFIASTAGGAYLKRKGRVDSKGKKIAQEEIERLSNSDIEATEDRLSHNNPLIAYLRKEKQIIVLEALERKIEDTQDDKERKKLEASKEALDTMDSAVVAPIIVSNNLNAVLVLGPKLSGDPYGTEDLQLLSLLGPQLASALEKSRLFEEVKQFSERLKKEIAIATEDVRNTNSQLNERNRYLTALQNVTNLITKTLDFRKVTQSIADSISSELGYMGGILMLLGKDKHKLFADAVTNGLMTPAVQKLIGKPLSELYGDFRTSTSRTTKAIKTGQVQIGTSFAEFLSPALSAEVCDKIQTILGIKSVISVPIYSEDGIVGAIDFILNNDPGSLKDTDLNMMRALCNQTGIVYRNIE